MTLRYQVSRRVRRNLAVCNEWELMNAEQRLRRLLAAGGLTVLLAGCVQDGQTRRERGNVTWHLS